MRFIHHDLGYRQAGDVVEVTLAGNAANVRLLARPHLGGDDDAALHDVNEQSVLQPLPE